MLKFGVERCRLVPIHEKDLTIPDDSAALPDGECATAIVAPACRAHVDSIDSDMALVAAQGLTGSARMRLMRGTPHGRYPLFARELASDAGGMATTRLVTMNLLGACTP
jgi:hypothetical protein